MKAHLLYHSGKRGRGQEKIHRNVPSPLNYRKPTAGKRNSQLLIAFSNIKSQTGLGLQQGDHGIEHGRIQSATARAVET